MKDNTLVSALSRLGHDALLIPTYTPIRTDEEDVSQPRIFFGGINVYLQQNSWLFRHTPWLFDRFLDFPRLLRWVSRFAVKTRAETLGGLTISMLLGRKGNQRKEVAKLIQHLKSQVKPEVVLLTNVLLSGMVPAIKEALGVPVLGLLQGDDVFLDALPERDRNYCIALIGRNAAAFDAYIASSRDYADYMADYLHLPREQIHVVYPGLHLKGHGGPREFRDQPPYTIGYFARISPEKGFHLLTAAYRHLRTLPDVPPTRLRVSGWLGEHRRAFFEEQIGLLRDAGLGGEVEYIDCPGHTDKVRFLQSLDILSVPAAFREPKGLYVLEAMANGVPVVQPGHGSFPELVEATGGGLIVAPGDPKALAEGWRQLLLDPELRRRHADKGKAAVFEKFNSEVMAEATLRVLERYVKQPVGQDMMEASHAPV